ncbi:MAG: AsmA family protein [Porticoccaceae bacterium]
MATAIKWILGSIVAVIVVAIGAGIIATLMIDPNQYKPELAAIAARNDIDLKIPGNLSWHWFPQLAVDVGEMRIADIQQRIPPATAQRTRLELSWPALLRGRLTINTVTVDGLDIVLPSSAATAIAVAPVAGGHATRSPSQTLIPDKHSTTGGKGLALAVETFSATNSRITLSGSTDSRVLNGIAVNGSGFNLDGRPFPLTIAFDYGDSALPDALDGHLGVDIETRVSANPSQQTLMLTTTRVALTSAGRPPLQATFDLSVNVGSGELIVDKLAIIHGDAHLSGQLVVQQLLTAPTLQGQLSAPPFNLRKTLTDWNLDLGRLSDATALTSVGFSANIAGTPQQLNLNAIELSLDDSHIRGAIRLGLTSPRQLTVAMNGDLISVDRYSTADATSEGAAAAIFAPLAGALTWLDGGSGTVETTWQTLVSDKLQLDDLHLAATVAGGRVDIADLSAKLLAGQVKATALIRLDATPSMDFKSQIDGVSISQAATAFATNAAMDGRLDLALSGTTQGETSADLQRNLHATGKLHIAQPVLNTLNLERSYCELTALLGKSQSPRQWPPGTQLRDIDSGIRVAGDNLSLDGYTTGIGHLRVRGDGVIDIAKKTFDVLAIARLTSDRTSDNGCVINSERLRNRDIPLRCKDSFAAAGTGSCKPDGNTLEALLQEKLIDAIKDKAGATGETGETGETKDTAVEELLRGFLERRNK